LVPVIQWCDISPPHGSVTRSTKNPPEQWEGLKLGAGAGFEPAQSLLQALVLAATCKTGQDDEAQLGAQSTGELQTLLEAWPRLPTEMRAAVLTIVRAAASAPPKITTKSADGRVVDGEELSKP
jgi:hypothetical protein